MHIALCVQENLGDFISRCEGKTPMCFETFLKRLFDEYGLVMNFEQYVLVGSTVRSYLSWLKDNEKIKAAFTANFLM